MTKPRDFLMIGAICTLATILATLFVIGGAWYAGSKVRECNEIAAPYAGHWNPLDGCTFTANGSVYNTNNFVETED